MYWKAKWRDRHFAQEEYLLIKTEVVKSKNKKEAFTQVPNRILNDRSLSLEAKGLLSIMLSNSASWKIVMSEIYTRSKNSSKSQQRVLKELKALGYVTQKKVRNRETKTFEWENTPHLIPQIPLGGKPLVENVPMESVPVGNVLVESVSVGTGGNNNTNENNNKEEKNNPQKTVCNKTNEQDEEEEKKQEKITPKINTVSIKKEECHIPEKDDGTSDTDTYDELPF